MSSTETKQKSPVPAQARKLTSPACSYKNTNGNNGNENNSIGECKVSPPKRNVEKIRDPTPEPIVKRCVKRNPTPPGDVIERVRVTRQPQQIIERVIEQPRKPPPKIIERVEQEPAPPPIIRNFCVLVDPTPRPEPIKPAEESSQPAQAQQTPPIARSPPPKAPTPQSRVSTPPLAPITQPPCPPCPPPISQNLC